MGEGELFYNIISQCMIVGTHVVTAVFLYIFISKFVKNKRAVFAVVVYLTLITILYYIPPVLSNITAYGIAMLGVLAVLLVGNIERVRLKIFLCVTFFVLRWLALGSVIQLMMLVDQIINDIFKLSSSILRMKIAFVAMEILQLSLEIMFLAFAIKLFLHVYKHCYEELSGKEFVMLLMPMFAQVAGYQGVCNYYDLYGKAMQEEIIKPVYEFNHILLVYYLISYIAILAFLTFYQELKETQEEKKEQELFISQMDDLKQHIISVENAYGEVRSLRHDMANHLMTLTGLIGKGEILAANEYAKKINEALEHNNYKYRSGNPVTDVIIEEYAAKFKRKGITFECDFHYPDAEKMDSFDMSIVLGNALQNAYEAVEAVDKPDVSLKSYRKKNAFIIEVSNSCNNKVHIDEFTGLPISTKRIDAGHGYGLKNIQRIAKKYFGDIQITTNNDGRFILNIMMMLQ